MKKSLLAVLLGAVMVCVGACGKTQEPEAAETVQEETNGAQEESVQAEKETEEAVGEQQTAEGMVTETAANHMTLLTPDGQFLYIAYPDAGVESDLEEGILLGGIVSVTYTGSSDTGDAVAVMVSEGSITSDIPREAYEFAIIAVDAIKFMDQEGLANMLAYPAYLKPQDNIGVTAKDKEGFMAIEREKIFTDALMELGDYNFFQMSHAKTGYIVGDGTPNFIFQESGGGFGITGINAVAEDMEQTSEVSE